MPSSSVHFSAPPKPSASSVSRHHDGNGYRIVGRDGRVLVYRDATFHGDAHEYKLDRPIVDLAAVEGRYCIIGVSARGREDCGSCA